MEENWEKGGFNFFQSFVNIMSCALSISVILALKSLALKDFFCYILL